MFFDYNILNELKRIPTDAPDNEANRYDLDEEEENTDEPPVSYDLDDEDEPGKEDTGYDLDPEENEDGEEEDYTDDTIGDDEPEPEEEDEDTGYDLEPEDNENGEEEDTEVPDVDTVKDEEQNNELKKIEDSLFNISDTGLNIRERDLKDNYIKIYNSINNILDKMNSIPKTSINISIIEFSKKKLYELKLICYDYLLYTYSDKTYIENQKNYIIYVGIIANINSLLLQIQPKME